MPQNTFKSAVFLVMQRKRFFFKMREEQNLEIHQDKDKMADKNGNIAYLGPVEEHVEPCSLGDVELAAIPGKDWLQQHTRPAHAKTLHNTHTHMQR